MKRLYQCEICDRIYDLEQEALECESVGVSNGKLFVGAKVRLLQRYPEDPTNPWIEREVLSVVVVGHRTGYVLDLVVQVGKKLWVGDQPFSWWRNNQDFEYRPLFDEDFGTIAEVVD